MNTRERRITGTNGGRGREIMRGTDSKSKEERSRERDDGKSALTPPAYQRDGSSPWTVTAASGSRPIGFFRIDRYLNEYSSSERSRDPL